MSLVSRNQASVLQLSVKINKTLANMSPHHMVKDVIFFFFYKKRTWVLNNNNYEPMSDSSRNETEHFVKNISRDPSLRWCCYASEFMLWCKPDDVNKSIFEVRGDCSIKSEPEGWKYDWTGLKTPLEAQPFKFPGPYWILFRIVFTVCVYYIPFLSSMLQKHWDIMAPSGAETRVETAA